MVNAWINFNIFLGLQVRMFQAKSKGSRLLTEVIDDFGFDDAGFRNGNLGVLCVWSNFLPRATKDYMNFISLPGSTVTVVASSDV